MKRKSFLRSIGIASGAVVSAPLLAATNSLNPKSYNSLNRARGGCVLIPSESPGPFPLDLSENSFFFRQDIREDRQGTLMFQKIRIVGLENCQPMPDVRVNIWCCDNDGNYSGYGGEEGQTYMRGYQITDDNGEVDFTMIFPGWYPGRVVHMHFQVFVSTSYSAVSQYTWPHAAAVEIANANPTDYTHGPDPMVPESDFAFTDGYENQLATCEWSEEAQAYVSVLEVVVEGAGVSGVGYLENEASKVFSLGQITPNPVSSSSTLSLNLLVPSDVQLSIHSISGAKINKRSLGSLSEGDHLLNLDFDNLNLSSGSYVLQLDITSNGRTHHDLRRFVIS
ncbi:MAG: hypothetical protein COA49_01770 [Bacteroidetes bacterium]|nr:MAG: hypothetical protein COA49_01770 [Bacteroidota bacterium]